MNVSNFIKINLKTKIIIACALFPLAIGCVIYFVVFPTINDIRGIKNEVEAQRIDLEVKYQKGQNLNNLTKNLKIIEPQLSSLDKIFIKQDKVLDFITTLENTANNNGVSQKINLATTNSAKNDGYQKTPLQLITSGNFINQLRYLITLENLNYYTNINSLEFTSGGQNSEGGVNMLVFADTYWK